MDAADRALNPFPWRGDTGYVNEPSGTATHAWWDIPSRPVVHGGGANGGSGVVATTRSGGSSGVMTSSRHGGNANAGVLATLQPQVAELLTAPLSTESSAHQLRQEIHLLRELMVVERKKMLEAKAAQEAAAANAPKIYSVWDMITGRDLEQDLRPDSSFSSFQEKAVKEQAELVRALSLRPQKMKHAELQGLPPQERQQYVLNRALDHGVFDSGLLPGQNQRFGSAGPTRSYNQH